MSKITWANRLTDARAQAADEGRLLLTYVFAPT